MTLPPSLNNQNKGLFPLKDFGVESSKSLRKQRTVNISIFLYTSIFHVITVKRALEKELKVAHMHSSLDQQQCSVSRKNYLMQLKAALEPVLAPCYTHKS